MYPPGLQENIAKVEAGREERFKVAFKRITLEEKNPLLKTYHPDYVEGAMRVIQVGPNKGEKAPNELVDLLEGNSRLDPAKVDLNKIDYDMDVLIIGGGGAGASAALLAQENGANVLLVTKLRLGDANTVGAQAGTQAADRPEDSPAHPLSGCYGRRRFYQCSGAGGSPGDGCPGCYQMAGRTGCDVG